MQETVSFSNQLMNDPRLSMISNVPLFIDKRKMSRVSEKLENRVTDIFTASDKNLVSGKPPDPKAPLKMLDWNRFMNRPRRELSLSQIERLKEELIVCCLTHVQDSYKVHLNRMRGLKIIETILQFSKIENINGEVAVHLTWSCLSCIHHFLLRLKSEEGILQYFRRRHARKAIIVFDNLLTFLLPDYYSVVLTSMITFFEEANLWEVEYFCSKLLQRLLIRAEDYTTESINEIMTLIENSTLTNSLSSRQILQVLFDIEEALNWKMINDNIVERFLDMYYRSVTPENNKDYNYEPLEKGLETCVRAMTMTFGEKQLMFMTKWMLETASLEDIQDENLLNFGSLMEHITAQYNIKVRERSLPELVFPLILKLIGSENLLYSLLGCRVLQNMIDRCNNKLKLDTPKIFFRSSLYNIELHQYKIADKEFFQRHRETLHSVFLTAVVKHGIHKVHLENIYVSIVLFLVEIPCGYTAAACVCLAMAIQEAALNNKDIDLTHAHRLHALVLSIMSLVCYIHKADVFYEYVDTIVERRANFAPHLNPPIKTNYKYAQHHVLWNKPELFFEDWEVRYGLWKCFKNKRKDLLYMPPL